jgi:hypothetical protein
MESSLRISPTQTAGLICSPAPDQYAALEKSGTTARSWISGPDWKKNMEIAAALCWNAALNGETSLICVSPSLRERVIQMLNDIGFQGLYFDLKGHADSSVLGAFQLARKKKAPTTTYQQAEVALQEFKRWSSSQEQGYHNLEQVLFGELKWKDIVDQRSTVAASAYQHFLTSSVKDSFDLTHKEYWHLRGRIKSFARLRTLRTPAFETLDALSPRLFEDPDASLKEDVVARLTSIVKAGREVLCAVADAVHAYKKDLTSDHQSRASGITSQLSYILQLLASGETKFGQRFYDESTLSNTWHALIKSTRPEIQSLHLARNEIREAFIGLYEVIQETHEAQLDEVTAFMPDPLTMEAIKTACSEIQEVVTEWSRKVDARASQNHKRINALNMSRSEDLRAMMREAENRIDAFVTLLAETEVLNIVPEVNALSIEKKAAVIEATVRLCLRLLDAAPDIDAYTLWTGFWSAQNNRTRAVLRCLELMEDSDLVQAFDTWYFGKTLSQIPDHTVASRTGEDQMAHPQIYDLRAALDGHLRAMTQTRRHELMRVISPAHPAFIQSVGKSQLNVFSEELRILPAKEIAHLFPVLLCTQDQVAEYGYHADTLVVINEDGQDFKTYAAQAQRCVMITQHMAKYVPEGWTMTRLEVLPMAPQNDWREVGTSERLGFVEGLATQFAPFLEDLRVYNSRGVQVFSFLGDRLDGQLMQRLGMPFKQIGEHGLSMSLVIECFLDRRKPIIALLRDGKLGQEFKGYLPWHLQTIEKLESCGVVMKNLWSVDLKNAPGETLDDIYECVREFAEHASSASVPPVSENSILDRDARIGPHTPESRPENTQPRG